MAEVITLNTLPGVVQPGDGLVFPLDIAEEAE